MQRIYRKDTPGGGTIICSVARVMDALLFTLKKVCRTQRHELGRKRAAAFFEQCRGGRQRASVRGARKVLCRAPLRCAKARDEDIWQLQWVAPGPGSESSATSKLTLLGRPRVGHGLHEVWRQLRMEARLLQHLAQQPHVLQCI